MLRQRALVCLGIAVLAMLSGTSRAANMLVQDSTLDTETANPDAAWEGDTTTASPHPARPSPTPVTSPPSLPVSTTSAPTTATVGVPTTSPHLASTSPSVTTTSAPTTTEVTPSITMVTATPTSATGSQPSGSATTTTEPVRSTETPLPSATAVTAVDPLQSNEIVTRNGRGSGGSSVIVAVGIVAGCLVLVGAVFMQHKKHNQQREMALSTPTITLGLSPVMLQSPPRNAYEMRIQLAEQSMADQQSLATDGMADSTMFEPAPSMDSSVPSPFHCGASRVRVSSPIVVSNQEDIAFDVMGADAPGSQINMTML